MPDFSSKSRATAAKKTSNISALSRAIDEQPELNDDLEKFLLKRGVAADRTRVEIPERRIPPKTLPPEVNDPVFPIDPFPTQPFPLPPVILTPPTLPPTQPVDPPTNIEIDTRLQILINSIPIANPGNLITSEYHNALREAVRGLASRIGLSVSPTAEFKILTFAPNFMPMKAKSADQPWSVTLERATIPKIDQNKTVAGGFVVQLPDSATIYQMIVRGSRAAGAPAPKDFKVTLRRQKFGAGQEPQTLIMMDLKDVKDGAFEDKESVTLSDTEVAMIDEDEGVAGTTVGRRKIIDNQKWIYTVTAEFSAGANTEKELYEINSVQILCTV